MDESNKTGKDEVLLPALMFGAAIGMISFVVISINAHSDSMLSVSELLRMLLLIFLIFGGLLGRSWHSCGAYRKKFPNARLDFKAIITFFLVMYFFATVALFLSSFWVTFPKAYYLYSALSLAGGLLLGSLIDFGGRKIIGMVKK